MLSLLHSESTWGPQNCPFPLYIINQNDLQTPGFSLGQERALTNSVVTSPVLNQGSGTKHTQAK